VTVARFPTPGLDPVLAPGALRSRTQPELRAQGCRLRPWTDADVPVVESAYADPAIRFWHMHALTRSDAQRWITAWLDRWEQENGAGWAVVAGSAVAGQVSFRTIDLANGTAELSYWVLPSARRQGLAMHAVMALTRWAFEELGLTRVELMHSTQNPRSCAVAQRTGFQLEGVRRQHVNHADGLHDMHLHARVHSRLGEQRQS